MTVLLFSVKQQAASALQKKMVVLKILVGKGLTQEMNLDGSSVRWAPGAGEPR